MTTIKSINLSAVPSFSMLLDKQFEKDPTVEKLSLIYLGHILHLCFR